MFKKSEIPSQDKALPGRTESMRVVNRHYVNGQPIQAPFADGMEQLVVGMGCFWGAERRFWEQPGVVTTAVGYAGGITPNPTYEEVCSGLTGHTEVVLVVFNPEETSLEKLLAVFWESHDPTQGMRQGNDRGTQYRSAIYCFSERQLEKVRSSKEMAQQKLNAIGYGAIATEIKLEPRFYYAESYHQQYLAKNPGGYCGLRGTGIHCS